MDSGTGVSYVPTYWDSEGSTGRFKVVRQGSVSETNGGEEKGERKGSNT